jgi:hypothetical protein
VAHESILGLPQSAGELQQVLDKYESHFFLFQFFIFVVVIVICFGSLKVFLFSLDFFSPASVFALFSSVEDGYIRAKFGHLADKKTASQTGPMSGSAMPLSSSSGGGFGFGGSKFGLANNGAGQVSSNRTANLAWLFASEQVQGEMLGWLSLFSFLVGCLFNTFIDWLVWLVWLVGFVSFCFLSLPGPIPSPRGVAAPVPLCARVWHALPGAPRRTGPAARQEKYAMGQRK